MGDTFTLNGDSYHIIANSPTSDDYVVALKDVPLKATEITAAGGTVNYTYSDTNQTGRMAYGETSTYATSAVKSVVDSWATSKFTNGELKTVDGYSARLIKLDELTNNLGYEWFDNGSVAYWKKTEGTPSWVYNSSYQYWTMTPENDSNSAVWEVTSQDVWGIHNGSGSSSNLSSPGAVLRPVINVYKSKITS